MPVCLFVSFSAPLGCRGSVALMSILESFSRSRILALSSAPTYVIIDVWLVVVYIGCCHPCLSVASLRCLCGFQMSDSERYPVKGRKRRKPGEADAAKRRKNEEQSQPVEDPERLEINVSFANEPSANTDEPVLRAPPVCIFMLRSFV